MTDTTPKPTQASLKRVLRHIAKHRDGCVKARAEKARQKFDAAREAVEDFERTNKEYKRLMRARERARDEYYKTQRTARQESSQEVIRLTSLVDLNGATPAVIKEITKVAKKYGLI